MQSPRGRILNLYHDSASPHALVEVGVALGCARCAAGKGCGAGIVGGDGKRQRIEAAIAGGVEVREGDEVRVELAPNNVLEAALVVYGLPLAGAVLGAVVAHTARAGDGWAVLAATFGLAAGVAAGRLRLRQATCLRRFTPVVTAKITAGRP